LLMKRTFNDEISDFVTKVKSIEKIVPQIMSIISLILRKEKSELKNFIDNLDKEQVIKEDGKLKVLLNSYDDSRKIDKAVSRITQYHLAYSVIPRSLLVSLISIFDAYLGRLIRAMFTNKPQLINLIQKTITLSDLNKFSSLDEAKEYLIDQEIESVLRNNHTEHFLWLEKKLNEPIIKDLKAWPQFIEITERRNLFVHTDGVISSQYLNVCQKNNYQFEREYKIGDVLEVSRKYFENAVNTIYEIGILLGQLIWRKLLPHEVEEANISLIDITFDFIVEENYHLAINLLSFALDKWNIDGEEKYIFLVNLAQSYKWLGQIDKCIELLDTIKWEPLSNKFQIANYVLRDKFDEALRLMGIISKTNEISKEKYKEWPLFKEFIKREDFKEKYREIYGEIFDITEVTNMDYVEDQKNNELQMEK